MKISFSENAWQTGALNYAYSYRFEETPVFVQKPNCIENRENPGATYGFDNISLLTAEKIGPGTTIYGTYYISMSMFLAFAALHPEAQVLLFFIIPIKIKWLAILDVALFAVDILAALLRLDIVSALIPIIALLNFLVFFWSDMTEAFGYQRQRARHQTSHKTIQFKTAARQQQKKDHIFFHEELLLSSIQYILLYHFF